LAKSLGSGSYQEREEAGKGYSRSAPTHTRRSPEASRAEDLEASRRAGEIVKQLEARYPKKDLKTTAAKDRVVTTEFTIIGRIMTPAFKLKWEWLGELDVPVARLRALRVLGVNGDPRNDEAKIAKE
jgi:hypothetical protein